MSLQTALAAVLLVMQPLKAQVSIDPNFVYNISNPVEVILGLDNYTRVQVVEKTAVTLNCSYVRSTFIHDNNISNLTSVTVQWWLSRQQRDFMTFHNAVPVDDGRGLIFPRLSLSIFNDVLEILGVQLPGLNTLFNNDATTGEYTCEVCHDLKGQQMLCANSTIPIIGIPGPPSIRKGGQCGTINTERFRCKVGANYCISDPAANNLPLVREIWLDCSHDFNAPVTPIPVKVMWFINGVSIDSIIRRGQSSLNFGLTTVNEISLTLIISGAVDALRGNYTCQLTNTAGSDVATTIISDCSRLPPIIQNGTRYNSSVIQIGYGPHCLTTREATITCQLVSGTVPITFSWSLPNSTIIAGGNHLVVSLPGKYSCTATNDFGNASASSEVIVAPCVDFFGMISKQTGDGCSRLRGPLPASKRNPDMCAYVGDRIQFTCTLVGKGEVTAPLISSPEGTVIITGLVIVAFVDIEQHTASGEYHCSFSTVFANGLVNRTIYVEVFDPPKINTTISLPNIPGIVVSGAGRENLLVTPGSIVYIYCPATGKPAPLTYSWLHTGKVSFISTPSRIIGGLTTSVFAFKQIVINRANYSGPPTKLDEDNTIIIGDSTCIPINGSVRINCSTYQSNLVYQWSKDGEVVTNPSPPNILTVTQRGNYTCTASNSASTENATSWIEVTPPSISFQIMSSVIDCSRLNPIPVNVTWCPRMSSRVDFQCTIDIPGQAPLITFNGTPLTASMSYIESFTASNNGMYRCSFQNTCGTSTEVEINLQAFQPAKVDITTVLPVRTWSVVGGAGRSDIRISIGGNVTLYCPTTGIDTPNIRWLLNGTTMVSNLPHVVITNETVNNIPAVVLTINNITTSDLVTYTCVTSNSDGTDTQSISIRDIDSLMSTSRTRYVKPSSPQVIVFPSIPAPEIVLITAIAIPSALGGILIFIIALVAVIIFIVLRTNWQKKKMIDVLEQDFRRRSQRMSEHRYGMPFGNFNDGVVDKRTSLPQIRPEILPLIGSAIILGRDIQLLDKIGQGEFGVVHKANFIGYNNGHGSMSVAVKTMHACCTEDDLKAFLDESLKMKELCHPNVMNLLGVCLDAGPTPYIVLPFMENGNLLSYIKKHRESLLVTECDDIDKISEVRIKLFSMCLQISKGMEYLASQDIIHRDLAARNCMIDGCGMVKVADFGLSKSTYEKLYFRQENRDNVKLPVKWLAVECIEDGVFSEKSDVWAFGVTCWEVFSGGKMPYGGLSPLSLAKLLKDGERMEAPDNAACSQEIYQTVMYQCWHGNPDERPTFSQLQTKISAVLSSMADYLEFSELVPCDEIDEEKVGCQELTIVASSTPSSPDSN